MEKPEISIIVPIYNMEKYLRECLDSIQTQTFSDWECILVDDGSKDSSPTICDEFTARDHRFKVIHKKNGGLSSARNAALKVALGQYIGFVDADDWIEPEMFECLYNDIIGYDAELAQIGYRREYKGRHSTKHLTDSHKVIDGQEAMKEIGMDRLPNYVWNKLHKRSIINCEFPEGRNFEDIYVYSNWLKNVNKMVLNPRVLYHYRMRKGSIIHSDVARNRGDYFLSCIDRMKMIESSLGKNDAEKRNCYVNRAAVNASKIIARDEKDIMLRHNEIKRISEQVKAYPLPSPKALGLKKWWRANLLRNNPRFFSWLMRSVHILDFDAKYRNSHLFD